MSQGAGREVFEAHTLSAERPAELCCFLRFYAVFNSIPLITALFCGRLMEEDHLSALGRKTTRMVVDLTRVALHDLIEPIEAEREVLGPHAKMRRFPAACRLDEGRARATGEGESRHSGESRAPRTCNPRETQPHCESPRRKSRPSFRSGARNPTPLMAVRTHDAGSVHY